MRRREEDAIQIRIWAAVTPRLKPGVEGFHVPNGGHRSPREAADFQLMGVVAGVPDLLFFAGPPMAGYALEVKTAKGVVSDAQERFRQRWLARGGRWAVARSERDAILQLTSWGLID